MHIIRIPTGDITDITDTMHLYTAEWQHIIQVTAGGQVVIQVYGEEELAGIRLQLVLLIPMAAVPVPLLGLEQGERRAVESVQTGQRQTEGLL